MQQFIQPMHPSYLPSQENQAQQVIAYHGMTLAEIKEDGYRVQLHKHNGETAAYTRSGNAMPLALYPELQVPGLPDCILDAELVGASGVGKHAFNAVRARFRPRTSAKGIQEYFAAGLPEKYPLELKVFDVLSWEGTCVMGSPLSERRKLVERILEQGVSPSVQRRIADPAQIQQWFDDLTSFGHEGLVCKDPASPYRPGERTLEWIKLKRAETLDLAVLGVYRDGGRLDRVLCGTRAGDAYETLAIVNARGMGEELETLLAGRLGEGPAGVRLLPSLEVPAAFADPGRTVVVEVAAMNIQRGRTAHSCGYDGKQAYSLRLGWLRRIRHDKSPQEIATTDDVRRQYEAAA